MDGGHESQVQKVVVATAPGQPNVDVVFHQPKEEEGVKIGFREIYDTVVETRALVAPLPATVHDHENRIRVLERFMDRLSGGKALAYGLGICFGGGALGFVGSHVIHW